MFNRDVLELLKNDVGVDVLAHLLNLFREELEAQQNQLAKYPSQTSPKEVRDLLHILKNTSKLYGVTTLSKVAEELYQYDVIEPTDVVALRRIILDTVAALPTYQEVE